MRTFIRRSRRAFWRGYVQFISVVLGGTVLGFSTGSTTAAPMAGSGLKPISQAATKMSFAPVDEFHGALSYSLFLGSETWEKLR